MSEAGDEALTWTVRLSDKRPERVWAVFGAAVAAMAVGTFLFHQPIMGLLGAAMILGATADYWLGSRFRLDAKGASARTGPSVTAMDWGDVKRVLVRDDEVRLSPLEKPSLAENTRGVGLLTTDENRERVLAFVHAHVAADPRPENVKIGGEDASDGMEDQP